MQCRFSVLFGLVTFCASAVAVPPASAGSAPLKIVSEQVFTNASSQVTEFRVQFDRSPDFTSVDAFGRQPDEFQFYIDTQDLPPVVQDSAAEVIVRGGEIFVSQGQVRSRWATPPDLSDPDAKGWGKIINSAPVAVQGSVVTFRFSLADIGEDGGDGKFSYHLLVVRYGATSDQRLGRNVISPTSRKDCDGSGWRRYGTAKGFFRTKGECVSAAARG